MSRPPVAQSYRSGVVEILPGERRVLVGGKPAALGARAFDVLMALLERRERVVTKDELLDIGWPGLVVEENNLQVHVSALRKVLGRDAIATVPGRGYRFTLAADGEQLASPSLAANPSPGNTNVGAAVDRIIGREREVETLLHLGAGSRMLTIVGPGGVGKTRLARELARARLGDFPDGVWWVDLANLEVAAQLLPAVAAAAGLHVPFHGEPAAMAGAAFAGRRMLLLLDNCEHLLDDVAMLAAGALAAAPETSIVATSQIALNIQGEVVFRLGPLAVPDEDAQPEVAIACAVLHLFEQRAQNVDRRFRVDRANGPALLAVCRQLDGLPLAIEMAAAWAPILGPAELSRRLGDRFTLLKRSPHDASPRHESLRRALEWSYSLLGEAERKVFRRLALFRGSFRLDLAQQVCVDEGLDAWSSLEALAALVDKSLVQLEGGEPPRYRLLETARLYALEKLREHGEADSFRSRHDAVMAQFSRSVIRAFREDPPGTLARFLADYDDLAATFEAAAARDDVVIVAWTGQALVRIERKMGQHFAIQRRRQACYALLPGPTPEITALLWTCVAFSRHLAPPPPKLAAGRAEIEAWRSAGDKASLYEALCRHSEVAASAGEHAEAQAVLDEAAAIEDPGWPAPLRLHKAFHAALAAAFGEDPARLVRLTERFEPIAAEARSSGSLQMAKLFRAEASLNLGAPAEAIRLIEAEIPSCRPEALGHSTGTALVSQSLLSLGRTREAAVAAREVLPHALRNGVGGWILDCLAVVAARAAAPREAALLLGCADGCYLAVDEVRRLQDRRCAAEAWVAAGNALGDEEAQRLRREGLTLSVAAKAALGERVAACVIQDS